jgi:hypothetical protein
MTIHAKVSLIEEKKAITYLMCSIKVLNGLVKVKF